MNSTVPKTMYDVCREVRKLFDRPAKIEPIGLGLSYRRFKIRDFQTAIYMYMEQLAYEAELEAFNYLYLRGRSFQLSWHVPIIETLICEEKNTLEREFQKLQNLRGRCETQFQEISHAVLPDFWDSMTGFRREITAPLIFRFLDSIKNGRFDRWLRRHGNLLNDSGCSLETLFQYCRSDLAIEYLRLPLEKIFNSAQRKPCEPGDAASLLFCAYRLGMDWKSTKHGLAAAETLLHTQQLPGGWCRATEVDNETKPSVVVTCMAIHALYVTKPHGFQNSVKEAVSLLERRERSDQLWCDEPEFKDALGTFVLVEDSIDLARDPPQLTFKQHSASGSTNVTSDIDKPTQELLNKTPARQQNRRGRQPKYDPGIDAQIANAFRIYRSTHRRATYQEFAESNPNLINGLSLTGPKVKAAVARDRQR